MTAEAAKQQVDWKDTIVVEPMSEEQALTLLGKKVGSVYNEHHELQLARELDCIPLALTQTTAYICQSVGRCANGRYLEKLKRSDASDEECSEFG